MVLALSMLLKILTALFLLTSCTRESRLDYPAKIDRAELSEKLAVGVYNKVYFDSNSVELNESAKIILKAQAEWLKKQGNDGNRYKIKIEGHSDERGTRECNLTLGRERANAAKKYLVFLGIESNKISAISYGKEKPEITGSFEEAWNINRRAVTIIDSFISQTTRNE
jgi:peptidoglycan-associated lipoprotein